MEYSYFNPVAPTFQTYAAGILPPTPAPTGTVSDGHYSTDSPDVVDQTYGNYDRSSFVPQFGPGALGPELNPPRLDHRGSVGTLSLGPDGEYHNELHGRSSSEEKEALTPAKSRRKAQNRAAQRAFRERKERHVKELEQKLAMLEQTSTTLRADNQRLKCELFKVSTENEVLRATASTARASTRENMPPSVAGPMKYEPTDFQRAAEDTSANTAPRHRLMVSERTGERLLNTIEAWDYIQKHPLFQQGAVDVVQVSERLRKIVQCDGTGPAFEERSILAAIEAAAASSRTGRLL